VASFFGSLESVCPNEKDLSEMRRGTSQKVKPGASPVEQTMLAAAAQMMKISEGFMPTFHHIRVLIVVKLISAVWNLTMCAAIKPII